MCRLEKDILRKIYEQKEIGRVFLEHRSRYVNMIYSDLEEEVGLRRDK